VEIHTDAIVKCDQVLLVDGLIATGGTVEAAATLIQKLGGIVTGCAFVIDLPDLGGLKRLIENGLDPLSSCEFEGD